MNISLLSKSVLMISIALLTSCSFMKAEPGEDSGFLKETQKMSEQRQRFPFHKVWLNPKADRAKYTKIMIVPVNTAYLIENNGWEAMNLKSDSLAEDARKIAEFTFTSFQKAIRNDPNKRYQLVDRPGPNTLLLEMAIVEMVPSKAAIGALGLLAVPFGATAGVLTTKLLGQGTLAMEARLRDAETSAINAMFADREETKNAPINIAAATWYRGIEVIVEDWSEQMVELMNTPANQKVGDTLPMTLLPW